MCTTNSVCSNIYMLKHGIGKILHDPEFTQVRVRFHNEIARIEVGQQQFEKMLDSGMRENIYTQFKKIGFMYTALDLKGYRTGSMN